LKQLHKLRDRIKSLEAQLLQPPFQDNQS
jgi:hypothetical protein